MKLWERERHHKHLLEYYDLKISYYSNLFKLKNVDISIQDRRTLTKLVNEIQHNITTYQTEHKYFLELFNTS